VDDGSVLRQGQRRQFGGERRDGRVWDCEKEPRTRLERQPRPPVAARQQARFEGAGQGLAEAAPPEDESLR